MKVLHLLLDKTPFLNHRVAADLTAETSDENTAPQAGRLRSARGSDVSDYVFSTAPGRTHRIAQVSQQQPVTSLQKGK